MRREENKRGTGLREKKHKKVAPGRRGGRRVEARGFGDLRRGIYDVISSLTVNNFPGGCGRYRGGSRVRFAFFLARLLSWPISSPTGGRFLVRGLLFSPQGQIEKPATRRRDVLEILFRGDRKVISRR